jgi:hypothetical protein
MARIAAILSVIPMRINVTVPTIAAHHLQQRPTAVTALTRTVMQIPTAMMQTAWLILDVHTAVTLPVVPVRINATVLLTAVILLQWRLTAVTALTRTVTEIQTAMMQTVLAFPFVFVKRKENGAVTTKSAVLTIAAGKNANKTYHL